MPSPPPFPLPRHGTQVAIRGVMPVVEGGRFPAKGLVHTPVQVEADLLLPGTDIPMGEAQIRAQGATSWNATPLLPLGNDRFRAGLKLPDPGSYEFRIVAWTDHWSSWISRLSAWAEAQEDISEDASLGLPLVRRIVQRASRQDAPRLRGLEESLESQRYADFLRAASDPGLSALARELQPRDPVTEGAIYPLLVERAEAGRAAWYEMFPRSWGPRPGVHGTFRDVQKQLPRIRDLGFDVVYFPPIHPIGRTHRRGRNNADRAQPDDVGSPWAIGDGSGGHTSVHPALGTPEDFRALLGKARELGLEVALDLAFQCSPDHPWVREHPEWFRHRKDGSIRYAENPPKRYRDIYPLDFDGPDRDGLWMAMRDVVLHWAREGVRTFRVDNPHTKPFEFWEWLLRETRREFPDLVFLAEAFTRPRIMEHLAMLGFSQSYTYFTWRTTRPEIESYFEELSRPDRMAYFRPMLFTNTPDILSPFLQEGGPPAFAARAVLAATLSPLWGIYSGFEFCESQAIPHTEEYRDSEKYQLVWRDPGHPGIQDLIRRLNHLRHTWPALQGFGGIRFLPIDDPGLVAYVRFDPAATSVLLVIVNVAPDRVRESMVTVPSGELGFPSGGPYPIRDLLSDEVYTWTGSRNYVKLDPAVRVAHILALGKE